MVKAFLAMLLAMFVTTGTAGAIEWPLQLSDAKATGESMSPVEASENLQLWLGYDQLQGPAAFRPQAIVATPFAFAAYVFAVRHLKREALTPEDLSEINNKAALMVDAQAFATRGIHDNDAMVVVIKQNGNVIPSAGRGKPAVRVTGYPKAGHTTSISFQFPMKALDLTQPITIVVANAVIDGNAATGETSWDIDPTKFR